MASIPYPKTMVVVITTHGKIMIERKPDGTEKPALCKIPEGMTLTKIQGVAPGVCNYIEPTFAARIVRTVNEIVKQKGIPIAELSAEIRDKIQELTRNNFEITYNALKTDAEEVPYLRQYNYHFDKIVQKTNHPSRTKTVNKLYSTAELSSSYDDNILFMNTPEGEMNYLRELEPPYITDLHGILMFLQRKGVKNIILIDLSCSIFSGSEMTERAVRSQRRSIYDIEGRESRKSRKRKRSGGKAKRTRKKNKRTSKYKLTSKYKRILVI